MKLLTNDFFYSLILYVLNNVYPCLVILAISVAPFCNVIPYTITQISRQDNVIYLTGLTTCGLTITCTTSCQGTTYITQSYDATLGPCNVCGSQSFNFIDVLVNAFSISSCNVPASSTNIFIRITLPPDIA